MGPPDRKRKRPSSGDGRRAAARIFEIGGLRKSAFEWANHCGLSVVYVRKLLRTGRVEKLLQSNKAAQ
jgi:hypothetical protein